MGGVDETDVVTDLYLRMLNRPSCPSLHLYCDLIARVKRSGKTGIKAWFKNKAFQNVRIHVL